MPLRPLGSILWCRLGPLHLGLWPGLWVPSPHHHPQNGRGLSPQISEVLFNLTLPMIMDLIRQCYKRLIHVLVGTMLLAKGKKLWHFGLGELPGALQGAIFLAQGQPDLWRPSLYSSSSPPHATLRDPQGTKKIETHLDSVPHSALLYSDDWFILASSPLFLTLGSNPQGQECLCSRSLFQSATQLLSLWVWFTTPSPIPTLSGVVLPALRIPVLSEMRKFRKNNKSQIWARSKASIRPVSRNCMRPGLSYSRKCPWTPGRVRDLLSVRLDRPLMPGHSRSLEQSPQAWVASGSSTTCSVFWVRKSQTHVSPSMCGCLAGFEQLWVSLKKFEQR